MRSFQSVLVSCVNAVKESAPVQHVCTEGQCLGRAFRVFINDLWTEGNRLTKSKVIPPVGLFLGGYIITCAGKRAWNEKGLIAKGAGITLVALGAATIATTVSVGGGSAMLAGTVSFVVTAYGIFS